LMVSLLEENGVWLVVSPSAQHQFVEVSCA